MANKLAIVTGNFTTAGTWVSGNTGTNAVLVSTSSSVTALTTGNLDSATFVPAGQASQYLAVRLGARGAGSPSNKLTVILRNSTTAADIWTFVVNVSDLPACTTADDCGGWIILKAAAALTPNGTDSYVVRCKLDSTSTAVSLCTNGTANNWQRQLFQTATGAPAAADDMLIGKIGDTTNPAVFTAVTVTMDSTAATDYGSNTTNYRTAALNICNGGTLTFGTSASTAYILQLSGYLEVYSGGTLNQGTSGTPIPRGSTARLLIDAVADVTMGIEIRSGATRNIYGVSPLSGVSNTYALLTADMAVAATASTTDRQLSAANGNEVGYSPTGATQAQFEVATLNGDAGATSLSLSAGTSFAHTGTGGKQGTVVSLTRNARVESVSATFMAFEYWMTGSTTNGSWATWQNVGQGGTIAGLRINNTSATLSNVVIRDSDGIALSINSSAVSTALANVTLWDTDQASAVVNSFQIINGATSVTAHDIIVIGQTGTGGRGVLIQNPAGVTQADYFRVSGCGDGILVGEGAADQALFSGNGVTYTNWAAHSSASDGIQFLGVTDVNLTTVDVWSQNNGGITFTDVVGHVVVRDFRVLSVAGVAGILLNTTLGSDITLQSGVVANGNGIGLGLQNGVYVRRFVLSGVAFGTTAGGAYSANTTDVSVRNAVNNQNLYDIAFDKCSFDQSLASTFHTAGRAMNGSVFLFQAPNATLSSTFVDAQGYGKVSYETSTVDVSPSIKLTPVSAALKLDTAARVRDRGFYVPVDSGVAPTVSVKVQTDGSYNGNAPRLILKANASIGITSDAVIATWSGLSGSFVTLSGTTASPTAPGVMEFVVDCDGTAGNVYVDTLSVTNGSTTAPGGMKFWSLGLPAAMVSNVSGGSGSAQERSYVFAQ